MASEVGAPRRSGGDWPWSRTHIGPPAGPLTNWQIKGNTTAEPDGSLYVPAAPPSDGARRAPGKGRRSADPEPR